ncbi:hypothetical protein [Coraliomargarita parva]|uniref:hypothetical protein n=1 Tax=Coraliomargarita parva TaxID=3014050 RepID=UPI0022B571E7|nr:hypothetical protein [Coraliomargarita parva]
MTEPSSQSSESNKKEPALDLQSLSGLDFGPSWADEKSNQSKYKDYQGRPQRSGGKGKPKGRDRRQGGAPIRKGGPDSDRGGRGPRAGGERRKFDRAPREQFEPTVKVDIYPQDEAFDALIKRLRATARTYQLFEIAHLLLEKPERFVVVVSNKKSADGQTAPLFFSVPGHLPFETEEAAINHVLSNHLDLFFEIEEIEVEAPKGNFPMVNRCTLTGELLGPPNYHRYQEFVQRHYANRIQGMSYDHYLSKIETVKDEELIQAWMEAMKKGARYVLKDRAEGEPEALESLDAVRYFLLQHRKDKIVGSGESIRFAGRDIERLPKGNIRRSVETYVEQQQRFPLDSANNIRGRLRRHKFTVYKKGSKGVSFVCAVKRRFRDSQSTFTDSIGALIDFIEKNPNVPASKLPKLFIGIDTEKHQPQKLKMADESSADAGAAEATEGTEAEAEETPVATTPSEIKPKEELSAEEQAKLNQLMLDLRWLITEGYVTEYGDGRLFAPEPMPEPKAKPEAAAALTAVEEKSEAEAPAEPEEAPVAESPSETAESVAPESDASEDASPKA